MSLNPTLTISIARTSLSLSPLVLSAANDANSLGLAGYQEPAIQAQVRWAPDSAYLDGSVALASRREHTLLNFDAYTDSAATEAASRSLIADLRAAVNQWEYLVTVTVDGATAEVWTCQPGSVGAATRSYEDLRSHTVTYPVSIPCHPVRA